MLFLGLESVYESPPRHVLVRQAVPILSYVLTPHGLPLFDLLSGMPEQTLDRFSALLRFVATSRSLRVTRGIPHFVLQALIAPPASS